MIRPAWGEDASGEALLSRFETMVSYNLDKPYTLPSARIDSVMATLDGLSLGDRIAAWARFFQQEGKSTYLFGLDPGGYVAEGRLVDDFHFDCVLFLYRTTELGRSTTAREAVQFAFGTRFYGAAVEEAIRPDGRVDYEHPAHLEYSEEIVKSGIWGKDVTADFGGTEADPGNGRLPAGDLRFVPKGRIDYAAFRPGDQVFFLLDENHPKGKEERAKGTVIRHLGVIDRQGDDVYLIHAAAKGLAGHYEGGKIERIPLRSYLDEVGLFKGIVVTRIEEF
ncbi:MAG: hypothetical protein ACE15D_09370 [Candidatus Eisenbacteria bacterium]|nr:hypothetical protein [Candidatus Eisenbacteria bacterium]